MRKYTKDHESTLSKGDSAGFVESVKAASDIYAPLSGEVTEVNTRLENEPETVNIEPLGEGWIYKMKLSDIGELDDLMSEEDYQKFLSTL